MRYNFLSYCLILSIILSSCAGINVYSDGSLKHKTAIKVHLPKPFLLVERSPAKDVDIKATIVYLPDLSESLYIKAKNGIGTSNLTLNLEKGYLSQYGAVIDSKTPEIITAVTGGLAAFLPFTKSADTATEAALQAADASDLLELERHLINIKKDIEATSNAEMTQNQLDGKAKLTEHLQKAIDIAKEYKPVRNNELYKLLTNCVKQLDGLMFTEPQSEVKKKHNDVFAKLKAELDLGMATIRPSEPPIPVIELYEILYDKKGYSLKRVS